MFDLHKPIGLLSDVINDEVAKGTTAMPKEFIDMYFQLMDISTDLKDAWEKEDDK